MNMFNSVILIGFWDKSETKNIIKILEWCENIVIDKDLLSVHILSTSSLASRAVPDIRIYQISGRISGIR